MHRHLAAAASATLALAALAGCGGDDEEVVEATPEAVLAASQQTLEAESASVEYSVTIDLSSLGIPGAAAEPVTLGGDGVVDFAGGRSELTFDLGAILERMGGAIPEQAAAMFAEPARTIQDGTTTYLCASFVEVFAGAECLSVDLSEQFGEDAAASLFSGGGADPSALLRSLGGAGEVEPVGEEELFGVTTQHLRGTFTLAEAMAALPEDAAAELQSSFERLGVPADVADTEQAFEVWIDGDGLVRQVRQTIDLGAATGTPDAEPVVVEFRYVEFDVDTSGIEVPTDAVPASELPGFGG